MKNVLLLAASGLLIAGLTSCKKEYTCNCTTTITTSTGNPTLDAFIPETAPISSSTTDKQKKKESEEWCKSYEGQSSDTREIDGGLFGTISYTIDTKTECSL